MNLPTILIMYQEFIKRDIFRVKQVNSCKLRHMIVIIQPPIYINLQSNYFKEYCLQ